MTQEISEMKQDQPLSVRIKVYSECSPGEIDVFLRLVESGGEVAGASLRKLVEKAESLAFVYDAGKKMVGAGAIKRPNVKYRDKIFAQAKVICSADSYAFELGWIYVDEAARGRGIGRKIVELLMERVGGGKIYATTRSDNDAMKNLLQRFGFSRAGQEYASTRGEHSLVLFLKN